MILRLSPVDHIVGLDGTIEVSKGTGYVLVNMDLVRWIRCIGYTRLSYGINDFIDVQERMEEIEEKLRESVMVR